MVRAILDGRKTQTRRVVKPQPTLVRDPDYSGGAFLQFAKGKLAVGPKTVSGGDLCPYGVVGDRLWVRERLELDKEGWVYAAGGDLIQNDSDAAIGWMESRPAKSSVCSPIHMPRWASRITLEITGVRVERLQGISEADAEAEGVDGNCPVGNVREYQKGPHSYHYAQLWDSINGEGSWAANQWVWAITFKRIK